MPSDNQWRFGFFPLGGSAEYYGNPFTIPEGQWVNIDISQTLSSVNGQARNYLWVDGSLKVSSTNRNIRDVTRPPINYRFGMVAAFGSGWDTTETAVFIDCIAVNGFCTN